MPDQDDINVDELLADIEAPAGERAMTSDEPEVAAADVPWAAPDWLEFDFNGQKVRPESLDQTKTWLSQGRNYSQRAEQLNRQTKEWEARVKAADEFREYYEPIDQYAKKDPDWWKHVEQSYQEKMKNPQGLSPELAPLAAELGEVKSFIGQIRQEKILQDQQAEDQKLDQEIDAIRKQYPTIDLSAVDESGLTLEKRVLDHAGEIRTTSFRAAFRDYLHDKFIDLAKTEGRQAITKDQETRARKGILGTTPAPIKAMQKAQNVRGKSYDDLYAEAKSELGIG